VVEGLSAGRGFAKCGGGGVGGGMGRGFAKCGGGVDGGFAKCGGGVDGGFAKCDGGVDGGRGFAGTGAIRKGGGCEGLGTAFGGGANTSASVLPRYFAKNASVISVLMDAGEEAWRDAG